MNEFIIAIWPWGTAIIGGMGIWILKRIEADSSKLSKQVEEIATTMARNREDFDHQIATIVRKFSDRLTVVETRCQYVHGVSPGRRMGDTQKVQTHWSEDSDVTGNAR